MKIGIITFHWATNYGAVLQTFATQIVLTRMGHNVEIINYEPKQFDNNLWTFLRYRKFMHLKSFIKSIYKEQKMKAFRSCYLNVTNRYYTLESLRNNCNDYDVLISGSDQVLNSSFLQFGEGGKSTAYFLDFGSDSTKKIYYAVSFGVTKYPKELSEVVRPITTKIDAISVRESTGTDIFRDMGRDDAIVVPDPTLLLANGDYIKAFKMNVEKRNDNYFIYMLHHKYSKIENKLPQNITVSSSEPIEEWIAAINQTKGLITNSFHGTVFAILSHTPFLVVLPTKENIGMNDRFFTMLGSLGLEKRVVSEAEFDISFLSQDINWDVVDKNMEKYRSVGLNFLKNIINKQ